MIPIHIIRKLIEQVMFNLHNTGWIVYVSVYVYMFLSVICCTASVLLSVQGNLQQLRHYQKAFLLLLYYYYHKNLTSPYCMGFPPVAHGIFLDYQRANEFDCWLITPVLCVLFLQYVFKEIFQLGSSPIISLKLSAYRDYIWLHSTSQQVINFMYQNSSNTQVKQKILHHFH